MGDRAVIAFESMPEVGVYLHWNGDLESVEKILDICRTRKYRPPSVDDLYAFARLVGVCHEFIDPEGGLSLGVGPMDRLDFDNFDNGRYWIGGGWEITRRDGKGSPES